MKQTTEQVFRILAIGGMATMIGMVPEGQMVEIEAAELINNKVLRGSNMGSNRFRVHKPKYIEL